MLSIQLSRQDPLDFADCFFGAKRNTEGDCRARAGWGQGQGSGQGKAGYVLSLISAG